MARPRKKTRAAGAAGDPSRGGARLQYAALPYRVGERLEVLLITSRDTGRWVLPKGWPMRGKSGRAAAAREALEEAGLEGRMGKRSLGAYRYDKRLADGSVTPCRVEVYPLAVEAQRAEWPEMKQRELRWFSPQEAAARVDEAELASLIQSFSPHPAA